MARDMIKWAYADHKSRAKKRNLSLTLSFDEWLAIWTNSGKLDLRGRGAGKYCMSRVGDKGGYDMGNVFIQSFSANSADAHTGKTQDIFHIEKRANSLIGKPSGMLGKTAWNKGILGSTWKNKHKEVTQ